MKRKIIKLSYILSLTIMLTAILGISNQSQAANTYYQYVKSGIDQFPASYREKLSQIAKDHPTWKFQAYYTGIPWDELIANERGDESIHRNRVTANAEDAWKHCSFVDNGWACASDGIVKYYLDPRNFLNDTQIFQFVETSYNEKSQTLSAIQNSVKGTFLDKTITCKDLNNNMVTMSYSQIILDAAKRTNISAFYIKCKIIQEVGSSGSGSVSGTYPGHEGYYNFFNYGAYDTGDPVANGLDYAREKGWDSPYKAIVGGADLIGKYYIAQGQNTAYFNKWDVVGTSILREGQSQTVSSSDMFWHQYMTNIQDPTSQSHTTRKAYESSLQSEITFIIPVYENMPASNPMPHNVALKGISFTESQVTIGVDEKRSVSVNFTPADATNKQLIWSCSDDSIVRVWENDYRGLKDGMVTITARSVDGGYTAQLKVIVKDTTKPHVTSINVNKTEYTVNVDEAVDIPFSYSPSNAVNAQFYWSSSDESILRVYENRFRALKPGTAYVIARTLDGTVEKKIKVTVSGTAGKVQSINVDKNEYSISVDQAVDIPFTYTPSNAVNAQFYWSSSDESILRVYENRFRGLKPGTAYVIVKTLDGSVEKKIKVTVNGTAGKVQSINVDKTEYTINVDQAVDVPFTYTPSNATNAQFYWSSSDSTILRVYENRFRGLKPGTAYVIVKTTDGSVEKKIKVTVNGTAGKVQSINVDKTEYAINVDQAVDVPFTYTPSNAVNAQFYWSSSDESILRVYENRFRGLKPGTAYVIVKTIDGTVEKRIKVTVNGSGSKVQSINVEKTEYSIKVDEAVDIPFTYTPSNATNAQFYWSSSDDTILRVYGNRFRGLKPGTAYVIARTLDGSVEKRIKVTVGG